MEPHTRLRLLEHATAELLESETNGTLLLGVDGNDCEPLVVTALGCSVLVATGRSAQVLIAMGRLGRRGLTGPRALAEGCDRTLRTLHRLPPEYVPALAFGNPVNASGLLARLGSTRRPWGRSSP
jgi:hypothetical protein